MTFLKKNHTLLKELNADSFSNMDDKDTLIISNLHKTFSTNKGPIHALRGVNLTVSKGEIFGFLGPNGAGKTTMLRILTTLLPFEKGSVFVAGHRVKSHAYKVRQKIGYVSQKGGAEKRATGRENLILQGRLYGLSQKESEKQAYHLEAIFELSECIHRVSSTYSGGQQRRLDIALGMMHRPTILFLDEPTTGLDPQNRTNLWDTILKLKKEGVTIFLTSHYLEEVDFLSDHLAIMDHGKIVATGTPSHLKKEIGEDIVTIGMNLSDHGDAITLLKEEKELIKKISIESKDLRLHVEEGKSALPEILKLLSNKNIQLSTIKMALPTLNDVFFKHTGRLMQKEEAL